MRSSSRNSRETLRALGLAAAASLLLGSAAQAGEHNFVLTAYTNGRGGQALVTGDYEAAGRALSYKPTLSAFDDSTNSNIENSRNVFTLDRRAGFISRRLPRKR